MDRAILDPFSLEILVSTKVLHTQGREKVKAGEIAATVKKRGWLGKATRQRVAYYLNTTLKNFVDAERDNVWPKAKAYRINDDGLRELELRGEASA